MNEMEANLVWKWWWRELTAAMAVVDFTIAAIGGSGEELEGGGFEWSVITHKSFQVEIIIIIVTQKKKKYIYYWLKNVYII